MKSASLHPSEPDRLEALQSFHILDTLPEEDFDNLARLACTVCDVPTAMVNMVDRDRVWFKSRLGLDDEQCPRDVAFCAHTVVEPGGVMVVPDARYDDRFADNPQVQAEPPVVFYAGVALDGGEGLPIGTLCLVGSEPKELSEGQQEALKMIAGQVNNLLRLRKSALIENSWEMLEQRRRDLEQFAYAASHDLQEPIRTVHQFSRLFEMRYKQLLDDEGRDMLRVISNASERMGLLVKGLLSYVDMGRQSQLEMFKVDQVLHEVQADLHQFIQERNAVIESEDLPSFVGYRTEFRQLLQNLIHNAIKYTPADRTPHIRIKSQADKEYWKLQVHDNAMGIPERSLEDVFGLFKRLHTRNEIDGMGIGLAQCRKIAELHGGSIFAESDGKTGSTFTVVLPM